MGDARPTEADRLAANSTNRETFEQAIERCLMDGTTAKALRVMADDFDDRLDFIETGALRQGAEGLDTLVARVADLTASLNRASDACASVQKERDALREMLGKDAARFDRIAASLPGKLTGTDRAVLADYVRQCEAECSAFLARSEAEK